MMRLAFAAFTAAALVGAASPAAAQLAVARSPSTAPVLGDTIPGASATTFSVSTSGSVTRTSGDAIRVETGAVRTPTITVSCGLNPLSSLCALRYIRVTITPVSGQATATVTRLRVSALRSARFRDGVAPAEGSTITFDIEPLGVLRDASFDLGMDVRLAARAAGGDYPLNYSVTVQLL